jgi:N utilization substance protein A
MRNEFEIAFNEITEMRALPREIVLEALQTALISAYRRDAGASAAQRVEANIDPNNGRARIYVEKEVVDEVMNFNTEVTLEKARYYDPASNYGDMVMVGVEGTTKKFGRIAAQTAKQVIRGVFWQRRRLDGRHRAKYQFQFGDAQFRSHRSRATAPTANSRREV